MMNAQDSTSTRPYLIRALYEWCTDNGLTPYVAVRVDESVQVPREYVKDGEIVLNVSYDATSALQLGNDFIEFKARFGGKPRDIMVPVSHVIAIYARENGQGMAFPPPADRLLDADAVAAVPSLPVAATQVDVDDDIQHTPERVMQLVPSGDDADEQATDESPRPMPPAGGGARPSLKRIK
ncbi:MAG: ClpXP protease specificity-enhancing factor [Hyphomicrobiales bacterium]|nr:MAG: ClpXP protease specificity-enhancing factor [Hyphomicrobiales bacterium]